jgi:hypothetical protein
LVGGVVMTTIAIHQFPLTKNYMPPFYWSIITSNGFHCEWIRWMGPLFHCQAIHGLMNRKWMGTLFHCFWIDKGYSWTDEWAHCSIVRLFMDWWIGNEWAHCSIVSELTKAIHGLMNGHIVPLSGYSWTDE